MKHTFAGTKTILLTPRDLEIFKLIATEGPVTPRDLDQKFWGLSSQKSHAGFQRIRKLIDSGYLKRGNPKLLYLSERAHELLRKKVDHQSVEGVKCGG